MCDASSKWPRWQTNSGTLTSLQYERRCNSLSSRGLKTELYEGSTSLWCRFILVSTHRIVVLLHARMVSSSISIQSRFRFILADKLDRQCLTQIYIICSMASAPRAQKHIVLTTIHTSSATRLSPRRINTTKARSTKLHFVRTRVSIMRLALTQGKTENFICFPASHRKPTSHRLERPQSSTSLLTMSYHTSSIEVMKTLESLHWPILMTLTRYFRRTNAIHLKLYLWANDESRLWKSCHLSQCSSWRNHLPWHPRDKLSEKILITTQALPLMVGENL